MECKPLPSSRHVDQYSLHRRIWCALCRLPTFGGTFSALSVSNHRRAYRLADVKIRQPWLFSKKPAHGPQIKAGLKRAVAQGVKLGRPKIDRATERKVREQLAKGLPVRVTPAPPARAALRRTSCHERPHAPARRRRASAIRMPSFSRSIHDGAPGRRRRPAAQPQRERLDGRFTLIFVIAAALQLRSGPATRAPAGCRPVQYVRASPGFANSFD